MRISRNVGLRGLVGGLLGVASLAALSWAHTHPVQCYCTKGPCVWQVVNTVATTAGPGSTATPGGAPGKPDAWANCYNAVPVGPPWPLPANATATRGDMGIQDFTGIGGWDVTYYWVDDFRQCVTVQVDGGDSLGADAESLARVDDLVAGTYQESQLKVKKTFLGGSNSGWLVTNVMTPPNIYQLAFGSSPTTIPLEATTQSNGVSNTVGNADATAACLSGAGGGSLCFCVVVQKVDVW